VKASPPQAGKPASGMVNGKSKPAKMSPVSRFSDPPAPPPQQPLPEKPAMARSSPSESASVSSVKRSETGRGGSGQVGSPTHQQSGQIVSLVEALNTARKELDSQGARVKHLEDMLRQERLAREGAEERARRLEHGASFRTTMHEAQTVDSQTGIPPSASGATSSELQHPSGREHGDGAVVDGLTSPDTTLEDDPQSRFNHMIAEMERAKQKMQKFQQRAEVAETDAASMRNSLSAMIERLRKENEGAAEAAEREILPYNFQPSNFVKEPRLGGHNPSMSSALLKQSLSVPNGHVRTASRLPDHLERAMATVLRRDGDGELLHHSAPYASMLGVVLIGVGLMAYLNSWQKVEN
jgi:hypothetical protein